MSLYLDPKNHLTVWSGPQGIEIVPHEVVTAALALNQSKPLKDGRTRGAKYIAKWAKQRGLTA